MEKREFLQGTIERVTYRGEGDGYVVARLEVHDTGRLVTIVGNIPQVEIGDSLRLEGKWVEHPRYGRQFRVEDYEVLTPITSNGIKRYLASGQIKGIGPVFAERLVERFGLDTVRVIEEEPSRLMEVAGIGEVRKERITRAWEGQKGVRDVMLFLQGLGIGPGYSAKIFKAYGHRAISVVKENPYRLAQDIFGIGFRTADRVAKGLGLEEDSPLRVEAGVLYALSRVTEEGHTCYPDGLLVKEMKALIGVGEEAIKRAINVLSRRGEIVVEEGPGSGETVIYSKELYSAEEGVARRLKGLSRFPQRRLNIDIDRAIERVEGISGLSLAPQQKEAVRKALREKLLVITGGPGTGKTTILKFIVQTLGRGFRVLLTAPTGRAAKRMTEAIGREAKTIHRLLEFRPKEGGFMRNERRPLDADMVIIDEASMIDLVLMNQLLKAIPDGCSVILVGDGDQLPSVGPGNVLRDLMSSGIFPVVTLTEVFRQAQASLITVNAHRINQGGFPIIKRLGEGIGSDFYLVEREEPEAVLKAIEELVRESLPKSFGLDPLDDIQVLSPMNKGIIGVNTLNQTLQSLLNPKGKEIIKGGQPLRVGDRVMQVRNNYEKEVFNGDIGRIVDIDGRDQSLTVRFDDHLVIYEFPDLDELVLAYAVTVHKSQGSEYPAVVIPLHTHHFLMLQRNLLYTAVTRGRDLVILVGTKKALAIAVKNDQVRKRYTYLKGRLIKD